MARKAKKRDATARPVTPAPSPRAARPPSNRGTFQAAQARRELAAAIPDQVYQRSEDPMRSPARPGQQQATPPLSRPIPANSKPARTKEDTTRREAPLTLKNDDRCKSRPTKTRGKGGSRAFVPWCRK